MKTVITLLLFINILYADYTRTKIQDYVNIVATQNNINIVTDKQITKEFDFFINKKIDGKVNISVLEELLNSNGYLLIKKSENYYVIRAKKDLLINQMKIYNIRYADTKIVKEKIDEILKGYFKNVTVYKDTSSRQEITPYDERKKGAANKTNVKEIEKRVNYSINILDNKSIAVTYKDEFVPKVVDAIISQMDRDKTSIRVTLKVHEVKTSALKELGTELELSMSNSHSQASASISPLNGLVDISLKNNPLETLSSLNFNAIIHALNKNGDSKIVAQPSVLLYEGESAILKDGKSFPIRNSQTDTTNTSTTTTATNYTKESTGLSIDLNFKEYKGGYIYLNMKLLINVVSQYDVDLQQLSTIDRELVNNMKLLPGQKIEIAGLTNKVESTSSQGIPFLMDIPFFGRLFYYDKDVNDQTILIIELKTEIVP